MKKIISTVIVCAIIGLFAGLYSIVDINTPVYDKKVDNSSYETTILEIGDTMTQTFVSKENKMDGVEVKIATSGNEESVEFSYVLYDSDKNKITEGRQDMSKHKNGKFFEFRFDTLTECQGKSFTFETKLEACDSETEVSIYEVPGKPEGTNFVMNKETKKETLSLRTITHRFNLETFIVTVFLSIYVVVFLRWLAKLFKG